MDNQSEKLPTREEKYIYVNEAEYEKISKLQTKKNKLRKQSCLQFY